MPVYQRTLLATAAILLVSSQTMLAQHFSTRYSRSIGMGNAYTGVAEGIETTYSNDAGLAAIDFYGAAYSSGQGSFIFMNYDAYDFAAVVPLGPAIGTAAFSSHAVNIDVLWGPYWHATLLQAHFGRAFGEALAFGACLNYYSLASNVEVSNDEIHTAVDFGLSGLYSANELLLPAWHDVLKAGVYVNNVLGSEWLYSEWPYPPAKTVLLQQFSLGASYRISPMRDKAAGRAPVTFLLAAALHYDNSIRSRRYTYDASRTSLGIEIQILELLQLRCGREEQRFLDDLKIDDIQHPVTRLGAGIVLPVSELIGIQSEYRLRLDYSHSIRENEDEISKELLRLGFKEPPKNTFTLQLEFKP